MSLSVSNLGKSYDGPAVLGGVNIVFQPGEVHALVGENGAGKSTLCRIAAGIIAPTTGDMQLNGQSYQPRSRRDAEHAGVRMVMQELNLLPTLTIAENIFLDAMPRRFGIIDYRTMNAAAASALAAVGLHDIAPDRLVGSLGVGQSQLVEIAAALSEQCRVLILDEPTAALTAPEIALLFERIRRLKSTGVAIVYVSHRMEEIRAIADRITVLRDGKHVATEPTAQLSDADIVRLMVGRELGQYQSASSSSSNSPAVLRIRGLTRRPLIHDVSFDLHAGEILGFAGLMGSGRTETMRAIFGADPADAGEIYIRDSTTPARIRSPRDAVRNGIGLLTEDRKSQGLLLVAFHRGEHDTAASFSGREIRLLDRRKARKRDRQRLHQAPRDSLSIGGPERVASEWGKSTEGRAGQMAAARLRYRHLRRADARHRCRRQVRDLQSPVRAGATGQRRSGRLFGSARAVGDLRPDRGNVRRAIAGDSPRAQCTQENIMSAALRGYSRTTQAITA